MTNSNEAKATPMKVWKYKRKDCPSFESEVKMTIETETDLIKEFGGIREYLNSMISGGVRITDHYLVSNTTK